MTGWELALIIIAVTFLVVNMVNVVVTLFMLSKYSRLFTKSAVIAEKVLDYAVEEFNDVLED